MGRVWALDRRQYSANGLLSLYQGDDWAVSGIITDQVAGSYGDAVDLSGYQATGYFPATGDPIAKVAALGSCGLCVIRLDSDESALTEANPDGVGLYVVLEAPDGSLQTVPTSEDVAAILERGFPSG